MYSETNINIFSTQTIEVDDVKIKNEIRYFSSDIFSFWK